MNRLLLIGLLGVGASFAEDEVDPLEAWFDQAEKYAAQQAKEMVESADESDLADELRPLEEQAGREWKALLKHARTSEDEELRIRLLKVEFAFALTGAYYELEFEEGKLAKLTLRGKIARYKKIIEELDEALKALEGKEEGVEEKEE